VLVSTNGMQQPWESNGLSRRVYLTGEPRLDSALVARISEAMKVWDRTKNTKTISLLEAFATRYKDTLYADLAKTRLAALQKSASLRPAGNTASKATEQAIAAKSEVELTSGDPGKVAALPRIEWPTGQSAFNGSWTFVRSSSEKCPARNATFTLKISNGIVTGPGGKGSITPTGKIWVPGRGNNFSGILSGTTGSGTYTGRCTGIEHVSSAMQQRIVSWRCALRSELGSFSRP
jgi:hypothetical protein